MMKKTIPLGALLLSSTAPVLAQQVQTDTQEEEAVTEIVVTATAQRGAIVVDTPPEVSFNPGDIRSLGATSTADLLSQIAPQTGGGRGEGGPVVLLNGKRISSFSEIRDIPSEAIMRVDVFPPEVALRYGYRATQRVVNMVLRPRFSSVQAELSPSLLTEGGRQGLRAQAGILRIRNDSRTSLDAQIQHQSALTEAERDIPLEFLPDARGVRTLLARTNTGSLNGTISRPVGSDVAATLNARADLTDTRAGLGLDADRPLMRDGTTKAGHLGLTLAGGLGRWQWTFTSNGDLTRTESLTDRAGQAVRDTANSTARTADADVLLNGSAFSLPAGKASVSLGLGGETERLRSRSARAGVVSASTLSRSVGRGQASIDLPITSRDRAVLGAIGSLSLNANAAFDSYSGFGTLATWGYGAAWTPVKGLDLSATMTYEDDAPSIQQLGNPVQATPDVRVFDYVRGETVTVTRVEGGNAGLSADDARIFTLGLTAKPFSQTDLTLVGTYTDTVTAGAVLSFPTATAALEAAFPSRFVRDAAGRLVSVDTRPVNVAETRQRSLRWGLNFSKRLGNALAQGDPRDAMRGAGGPPPGAGTPPPGMGPGSGGRPRFGWGGMGRTPRVQFAFYHTWAMRDDVQLANGLGRLDLLDGDAISSQGGASRHKIEAQGGVTKNGLGARFSANWQSPTRVDNAGQDLRFSSLATVDLRLFANLGFQRKLVEKAPWLRGAQIFIGINNIFDAKQKVRDGSGATPVSLLPDRLDPAGRSIRITFRKLFMNFRQMGRPQGPPSR